MLFKGKKNFLDAVAKYCPDTKVLYDRNSVVIIKVNSFTDCNRMFYVESIDWCIARSEGHWNDYVGKPNQSQYFIIDFDKINSNDRIERNNSLIGFTLSDGELMAAHARNDRNLLDSSEKSYSGYHPFEKILKEKGIYDFVIKQKMDGGQTDGKATKNDGMWFVWMLIGLILLAMCTLFFKGS